jgi:hypothetical protein
MVVKERSRTAPGSDVAEYRVRAVLGDHHRDESQEEGRPCHFYVAFRVM